MTLAELFNEASVVLVLMAKLVATRANKKSRGQAAIEYVLLVSFGLFIVIVGFTLAFYVKNFTDSALKLVSANRDVLLGFLLK